MNISGSLRNVRDLWIKGAVILCLLYGAITWLTFAKHPLLGEVAVRGLLDEEPNLTHTDLYHELRRQLPAGKHLDIHDCAQCFTPYSSFHNPRLKDGFYSSYLQPTFFYVKDQKKVPLLFSDRISGVPYAIVKFLKDKLSLKTALVLFHYVTGVLIIFFFGLFVRKIHGPLVSLFCMTLLSTSAIHAMNNGNFISKKAEPLFLWSLALSFLVSKPTRGILLSVFSWSSVFLVKSTALINLAGGLVLVKLRDVLRKKLVLCTGIFAFLGLSCLALVLDQRNMIRGYLVTSEYIKEPKYFLAFVLDFILMLTSPLKFLEYQLGLETWHYPFTTFVPSKEAYRLLDPFQRMKGLGVWGIFNGLVFFAPLFFYRKLDFKGRYLRPYLSLIVFHLLMFFAAHRYFTFSMYTWGSLGLVFLIVALFMQDLLELYPKNIKRGLVVLFITLYLGVHVQQLVSYVETYRSKGPIPTFSFNLYEEIAHDLEARSVKSPLMFFISEVGNLENYSEKVRPIYIHEKSLKEFGDLFTQSRTSYVLLQLKIDWIETEWPSKISKDIVYEAAKKANVKITHVKDYYYRDYVVYWLFQFDHQDKELFYESKVALPEERVKEIYETIPLYR